MNSAWRWIPWLALTMAAAAAMVPGDVLADWLPEALSKPGRDKVLHAAGFFLLVLCFRGWQGPAAAPFRWIPGAVVILVLFALLHEGIQTLIPGRFLSSGDFFADVIGIVVGVAVCLLFSEPKKV